MSCNCAWQGQMTCTCGQSASEYEDELVRTSTQEARHKGYNAGLKVGAERERQRLIAILRKPLSHPHLTLSKHDELHLYIRWLEEGGKERKE